MNGSQNKYFISGLMIQILNDCHEFSDHTIKYFMPLFTTYLCETAFLLYTMTNTKYRNKLAQNMGSAVPSYYSCSRFKQSLSSQASRTLLLRQLNPYVPSGHQATHHHIPHDQDPQQHCCEKLISHKFNVWSLN